MSAVKGGVATIEVKATLEDTASVLAGLAWMLEAAIRNEVVVPASAQGIYFLLEQQASIVDAFAKERDAQEEEALGARRANLEQQASTVGAFAETRDAQEQASRAGEGFHKEFGDEVLVKKR